MANQNQKDTLTGGKKYAEKGLPDGSVAGINKPEMLADTTYREGTSGSPDDQGGVSPFGKTTA